MLIGQHSVYHVLRGQIRFLSCQLSELVTVQCFLLLLGGDTKQGAPPHDDAVISPDVYGRAIQKRL